MKAASLLPLLAAGISLAAPAPSSNNIASHSLELDGTTISVLSENYEKYSFDLYISEYCNVDVKSVPFKPDLHVYAKFYHDNGHEYSWDFAKWSAKTFSLDNTNISIRHNYDTSETSFEYGDCKWKDSETVDKNCGWCDQDVSWKGPQGADQINCSEHPELYRYRTITCHLWRKTKSGGLPTLQFPPGEDRKGVAAATEDTTVTTSRDTSIKARAFTADGGVSDSLYRFGVTHSEWCENGALKARGWMSGRELNFYKDVTQKIPINLHPGRDLLFGPYSYNQHAFAVEYDGCVWTSDGGWPCGWCEMHPWTLGPLNCQTLQPGYQRTSYRTCYFVDNHMGGKASIDSTAESATKESTEENFIVLAARDELYSGLPTFPVNRTLDVPIGVPIADKSRNGSRDYWFKFSLSEYCDNGLLRSRGWWYDGNDQYEVSTNYGDQLRLHAPAPHDAGMLYVSPYNVDTHSLVFVHEDCRFKSTAGSQGDCGLCHPRLWTSGPLNCNTGAPGPQRDTYVICAFEDKQSNHIAGRSEQALPPPSMLTDNTTFSLYAPTTITPPPHLIDITPSSLLDDLQGAPTPPTPAGVLIDAQASTLILMPAIIETARPLPANAPPPSRPQTDVILPFHVQIWEYCFNGARHASGVYTNGNMAQSLHLKSGEVNSVRHRVPGYVDLDIGPFDGVAGRVQFSYAGVRGESAARGSKGAEKGVGKGSGLLGGSPGGECEWFDDETWKSCGECRAGMWSAAAPDCKDPRSKGMRVKDMDCSVLLGTKV